MKKYSEKFIDKYKILQNAIIGFEFECYMNTSYYKTLENLNNELSPITVNGFKSYHPNFDVTDTKWALTVDTSLGLAGCEIVTGAMDYYTAKYYLVKMLKFIQKYGYTNEKTAIHINLSFKDKDISNINILKLILDIDENEIYKSFPSRKDNIYAKSIKNMIPFKNYSFSDISIDKVKSLLQYPNDKYFGLNFTHLNNPIETRRLEFRYLGGKNYEQKIGDITDITDDFILKSYNAIFGQFTEDDSDKLTKYLNTKISMFKSFETYDTFLIEYPKIRLQVDQLSTYDLVNAIYPKIQKRLYEFFESVDEMKGDVVINYYSQEQKMEIINASFKTTFKLKGYDFINSNVYDGIFDNCVFNNCTMHNLQVQTSILYNCEIKKAKIFNCDVDVSTITDCYFEDGYMNSDMIGGILRSGKIGVYANISDTTEIIAQSSDNFFQTNINLDNEKKGKFGKF